MTFSIYLTFEDNCREAFDFYRSVFGGEFETLQTFGDGPPDMGVSEEARGRTHAHLAARARGRADGQ